MKKVFYGAAVVAMSLFAGSAVMQAADNEKVYELNVGEFSQLVVEGNINVDYKSDADLAGKAEFTATAAVADCIIFENNKKGKLTIQRTFVDGENADYVMPTVTVYSKFIKELKNSGDSTLRALEIRPTVEFKASVIGNGRLVVRDVDCSKFEGSIKTGNGTLVVSGKSESTVLSNTGTGAIQADNLESKSVSCHFFGTGTTGCWAIDDLKVKGLSGKLYYRDAPAKIRNYSMGVKIYSLDGKEWNGETSTSQSTDKEE